MDAKLPTIQQMYQLVSQKRDCLPGKYHSAFKTNRIASLPTKRSHYLDEHIRTHVSPGPASKQFPTQTQQISKGNGRFRTSTPSSTLIEKHLLMKCNLPKKENIFQLQISIESMLFG
jgi:hypothetical protein